jgi:hypothetical protein
MTKDIEVSDAPVDAVCAIDLLITDGGFVAKLSFAPQTELTIDRVSGVTLRELEHGQRVAWWPDQRGIIDGLRALAKEEYFRP